MTAEPSGALAASGSRALLIATAHHTTGSVLPDIPAAERSMRDLQRVLLQCCGLDLRNLFPLLDPATPQVVADVLTSVAAQATDTLLVYFVGHGLVDIANELHLATHTTTDITQGVAAYQALPYAVVAQSLRRSPARSIVIVLDCCFANRAHGTTDSTLDGVLQLAQQYGTYVVAAADGDHQAWAPPAAPHTAFTGELIQLLGNGDPTGPPALTVDHIYQRLARILPERGLPRPRRQASDRADTLVLGPNRAYRPPPRVVLPPVATAAYEVSPYPGLTAFSPDDAGYFFGREALTAQLVERLGTGAAAAGPLLVVGASGAGKSSLLRAGLIPALARMDLAAGGRWRWLLCTPGADPLGQLARHLVPILRTPPGMVRELVTDPARLAESVRQAAPGPVVLVVDQFEELFTLCADEYQRRLFVGALAALSRSSLPAVISVRADFYGHAAAYPELRPAVERPFVVGAMTAAELRHAIEGPADAAGLALDDGLTDLLLHDLGVENGTAGPSQGSLPLLSHALLATWQHREDRRLTLAGYHATGGIRGAIAKTADDTYHRLDPASQQAARRLLLRLVRVDADNQHTRRRVPLTELAAPQGEPDAVITGHVLQQLTRARLLTVDDDAVEITHEALIRAWPRLAGWIDTDRAGLLIHQQLTEDATAWQRHEQDPAFLYTDTRLADARALVREHRPASVLGQLERRFLEASEHRDRRGTRRRRMIAAGLVLISVLALTATAIAVWQRQDLAQQRDVAVSRAAATQILTVINTDPALAVQLSLAAYRVAPTLEARSALLSSSVLPRVARLLGHTGPVDATAATPGRPLLATAGDDGTIRLWDLRSGQEISQLTGHQGSVRAVVFGADGHVLFTGGTDGTIRAWNVTDPARPVPLGAPVHVPGQVNGLAAIPAAGRLVSATSTGTTLWDVSRPQHPVPLGAPVPGAVTAVAVSPNGTTVATGGRDHLVRLWRIDAVSRLLVALGPPLVGYTDAVTSMAFNPDGTTLAGGSLDHTVRLWNLTTNPPTPAAPPLPHNSGVQSVAFSPDGHLLATGSDDHVVYLFDTTTGRVRATFPQPETVRAVTFTADGQFLITAGDNGTVRAWNLTNPALPGTHAPASMAFSPDGRTLATISTVDGAVQLWDSTNPQRLTPLGPPLVGHAGPVTAVAFSPNGKILATGGTDTTIQLWDIGTPAQPRPLGRPLRGHHLPVATLSFSTDGALLASGSADDTVAMWDVHNPAAAAMAGRLAGTNGQVAFDPTNDILAVATTDGTLRMWDVHNPGTPTQLGTVATGHRAGITGLAFAPDGHLLATSSNDATVRLWNITTPTRPTEIGGPLTGHSGAVQAVHFGPTDTTLLSAGQDGSLRVWDLHDPTHPQLFAAMFSSSALAGITALAVSHDGHTVALGTANTTVIGDIDPDRVAHQICATAGSPITSNEWAQYFPDLPYQPSCP